MERELAVHRETRERGADRVEAHAVRRRRDVRVERADLE